MNILPLLYLFLSGFFFGGAINHWILWVMKSPLTPYGLRVGVKKNWLLGIFDLVIAAVLFVLFLYTK